VSPRSGPGSRTEREDGIDRSSAREVETDGD